MRAKTPRLGAGSWRPVGRRWGRAFTGALLLGGVGWLIPPLAQAASTPAASTLAASTLAASTLAGPSLPTLVDVRVGRHGTYDRAVFQFDRANPSVSVKYGTVYTQGKGDPLPLQGRAPLRVTFSGARAHNDAGQVTFPEQAGLLPGYPELKQVRFAGDFEGTVAFGLGLAVREEIHVFTLQGPPRVVVDIDHPD